MKIWSAKPTWRPRLLAGVELRVGMLGVDQRQDRVEQVALGDHVVHEEGLRHRAGSARPVVSITTRSKSSSPLRRFRPARQRAAQVFADGAADAAVAHLDDLLLRLDRQDVVVDVLLAELVLDDGDLWPCDSDSTREQRGLAAAQEAGEDGGGE